MKTLMERAKELAHKRGELKEVYDKYILPDKKDENGQPLFSAEIPHDEVKSRNAELAKLQDAYEAAKATDEAYQANLAEMKKLGEPQRDYLLPGDPAHPKGGPEEPGADAAKSLSRLFTASDAYKAYKGGAKQPFGVDLPVSVKSLLTTTSGYAPFSPRQPYVILSAQRKPVIADLIPSDDTEYAQIRFMEEVLFQNAAAAVAEGALKPEAGLQFIERIYSMSKIAVTLPVTDEQLMDVPQIEALLRNRLGLMVRLEEDNELLNGNGAANQLLGFLNKPGVLNTPKAAMDLFTAVYVAITNVRDIVGFADPSGVVLNPNNWIAFRTLKDTTGRFILGDPGAEGEARLWGLPVINTVAMPAGTGLTGDFAGFSHIDRKLGLRVDVGYVGDQFARNQQTLRAEERLTLEIYRAQAFSTIGGLPNGPQ